MTMVTGPTSAPVVLKASGVWKSYPGVQALRGVDFAARRGEVHALIGENGAGKSTLMGVCSGSVQPDAGDIEIGRRPMQQASPSNAQRLGLATVFQDDSLVPDLDVAQNLALGIPPDVKTLFSQRHRWAREQLAGFGSSIDTRSPVRDLSVASRQIVEISKALLLNPMVLVLDEPTAPLAEIEVKNLFRLLRDLVGRGTAVVYITHRLREVFALADRISVMRDGQVVAADLPVAEATEDGLVSLMVGRPTASAFPARERTPGEPRLVVTGLTGAKFGPIDLCGRAGEIIGLAGIEGNGQREILRALSGLEPRDGGVSVDGRSIPPEDVAAARATGVDYISGDRRGEAVFLGLGVRENLTVGTLPMYARAGLLVRRLEDDALASQVQSLNLRISGPEQPVGQLSGGNQQKVSIGRSFLRSPKVFLLEEPTQGVDAGSRMEIYRLLDGAAAADSLVIVSSSDAVELAGLCDRVLVVSRGSVVEELAGAALTEDAVVGAAVRADVQRAAPAASPTPISAAFRFVRTSDFSPVVLLAIACVLIMAVVGTAQPLFLAPGNLTNLMILTIPLAFVALGQSAVMLSGGIDLSVGPVVALATVAVAQLMPVEATALGATWAVAGALVIGSAVGLINGLLVIRVSLLPLIATLATYVFVQGVALLWLPTPGGNVSREFMTFALAPLGIVPWAFLALIAMVVAGEVAYRRSTPGMWYRAVGSRPIAAHRLGLPVNVVRYSSYILAALLAAAGGVFYTATIGLGEPRLGVTFTLTSITAVVLGGLSTWGGRGSVLGPFLGALLLAVLANSFAFLNWPSEMQLMAQGVLMLVAIAAYSRLREA